MKEEIASLPPLHTIVPPSKIHREEEEVKTAKPTVTIMTSSKSSEVTFTKKPVEATPELGSYT